jgi:hypothetical protein
MGNDMNTMVMWRRSGKTTTCFVYGLYEMVKAGVISEELALAMYDTYAAAVGIK